MLLTVTVYNTYMEKWQIVELCKAKAYEHLASYRAVPPGRMYNSEQRKQLELAYRYYLYGDKLMYDISGYQGRREKRPLDFSKHIIDIHRRIVLKLRWYEARLQALKTVIQ